MHLELMKYDIRLSFFLNFFRLKYSWLTVLCPSLQYSKVTRLYIHSSGNSPAVSHSLGPYGLYSPWDSPGQNTGVDSLSLLQQIFLTRESNWGLLHCRWILYQLSYQGSPYTYRCSFFFFLILFHCGLS